MRSDPSTQRYGHSVTELSGDRHLRTHPLVVVREPLDARGFVVSDRPMLDRMKVSTLLRLEELGADRDGRPIPWEAAHHVPRSRLMLSPTGRQQSVRDIEPVTAGRDRN